MFNSPKFIICDIQERLNCRAVIKLQLHQLASEYYQEEDNL